MIKINLDEYEAETNTFPAWRPAQEGDSLVGVVRSIQEINTTFGKSKRAIIEDLEGRRLSIILSAVLNSAFENLGIERGDIVEIKYLGQVKGKNKRTYNNYQVTRFKKKVE